MPPTRTALSAEEMSLYGDAERAPAPRRRTRRKRRLVLGFVPRILLIACVGIIGFACFCGVVTKVLQPYRMQHQQAARIHDLKSRLGALESQNGELQDKIAALKRPDGVETEARSQGFLKPGEVSLDITARQPAPVPQPEEGGLAGILQRAYHRVTGR